MSGFEIAGPGRLGRRSFLRGAVVSAATALAFPGLGLAQPTHVRVRLWSEGTAPKPMYPDDIDGALARGLHGRADLDLVTARLTDAEAGLGDAALDATDVLVWWSRLRHDDVPAARAQAVVDRVRAGRLGLIALHGSFASKPFRALMGTSCEPDKWRDDGAAEHVAVKAPEHPIAHGVAPFTIPQTAMFAEPFAVPQPESTVFVSSWDSGETFRSGLTWTMGQGRVFYFRPGHDGFPVFFHPAVHQVIANASLWVAKRA